MKASRRAIGWLTVLALLTGGCVSENRWIEPEAGFIELGRTRRAEVYEVLGVPLIAYDDPDEQVLVYRNSKNQGLTLGLRVFLVGFTAGSSQTANDSIFVHISDDDIVTDVRQFSGPADPGWPWWPF